MARHGPRRPRLQFDGWTSQNGPAAIQGAEDGARAAPHLLELVKRAADAGATGIIIGCFDDTALAQAAQLAPCPVVGLGQASYSYAALRNWRFSVVTTLSAAVPVLADNIRAQGVSPFLARIRASEVPVLALEADPAQSGAAIKAEAQRAAQSDDISAVILGCAGMVQVVADVRAALDIPVIDPVTCAAQSMHWLTAQQ